MLLDTPVCQFGWKAPPFALKDTEGKAYSLEDAIAGNGGLIVFICNHCPYVKRIADRLAADTRALMEEGIGVLAIMSNDYHAYPQDAPPKMREFAATHDFAFPYLIDEDQSVARAYGAVCTPDFFGFNSSAELQYRGRLDDAAMADASNREPELLKAMRLIAATGEGPREQLASMGCSIKWKNSQ